MASIIQAFMHSIRHILTIIELPFCSPNQIDHYFCDVFPLLKLACMDTYLLIIAITTMAEMMSVLTFVALVISYVINLSTLRTCSSKGLHKALSTWGLYITVLFVFFLPFILTYFPLVDLVSNDKVFALFYTIIAPMIIPLIYILRKIDIKNAIRKLWCQDDCLKGNEVSGV
uniref:G-protein coupled receptors family 1 profile domain-containing protein n=1 Tax=Equus asinus TaxID=9793 RepID=A0A9L0J2U6_EQUAS|nr:olfactory receptor 4P4-like [Equus asinus]